VLVVLIVLVAACAPRDVESAVTSAALRSPTPTAALVATRTTAEALSHIHHAAPDSFTLFARIVFTSNTTYDQATAILHGHIYPWTCDAPRSNDQPPLSVQRANFAARHSLLISYPTWDELMRIASSPQVISVEGTPLYQCP
jgi:hypothetical protein